MSNRLAEPIGQVLERAPAAWEPLVRAWRNSPAGQRLEAFVARRQAEGAAIYPNTPWRALELTPPEAVRVVILGQDPYHGPGQAEGLAFSVPAGQRLPPSLRNIVAELWRDLGEAPPTGHLAGWAAQGVLLLNTCLTVEDGRPGAHAGQGWEALTDEIVIELARRQGPMVFMLWGAPAQAKAALIRDPAGALVLRANHPSPLSARRPPLPFIGCGHFGLANRFLVAAGQAPIDWAASGFLGPGTRESEPCVL